MKIKLLASIALLGLSVGSAQAITLNFSDSHTADGEVDQFKFNVNSAGSVKLWTDTLQDGFDSAGTLFKLNPGSGKYDFVRGIQNVTEVLDQTTQLNLTGVNIFGIAIKNGYIKGDPLAKGISDTGKIVDLDVGSYLFTIAGFDFKTNAEFNGGGTLDEGWTDENVKFLGGTLPERQWSTWAYNTGGAPSPYEVYIEGDVSELSDVSAVPVPAAVWLFASAIAGLGATGRGRKQG
jgi:hypothetical protein